MNNSAGKISLALFKIGVQVANLPGVFLKNLEKLR